MNKLEQAAQQALGALVRAEAMYGQPNADIQAALREALAEQAEQETEVWYCPDCGTLSETQVKCCPDWIRSRKVPKNFAITCKATFERNEQAEQEPGENNDWKKVSYIRETLNAEQAEQEPVACPICGNGYLVKHTEEYCNSCGSVCVSPQTIQENVANKKAAPVRTKDLTDDDLLGIWFGTDGLIEGLRAVIAADREKNK